MNHPTPQVGRGGEPSPRITLANVWPVLSPAELEQGEAMEALFGGPIADDWHDSAAVHALHAGFDATARAAGHTFVEVLVHATAQRQRGMPPDPKHPCVDAAADAVCVLYREITRLTGSGPHAGREWLGFALRAIADDTGPGIAAIVDRLINKIWNQP